MNHLGVPMRHSENGSLWVILIVEIKCPLVHVQSLTILIVYHLDVPLGVLELILLAPLRLEQVSTLRTIWAVSVVVFAIWGCIVSNIDAKGLLKRVRAIFTWVIFCELEFNWSHVTLDIFKWSIVLTVCSFLFVTLFCRFLLIITWWTFWRLTKFDIANFIGLKLHGHKELKIICAISVIRPMMLFHETTWFSNIIELLCFWTPNLYFIIIRRKLNLDMMVRGLCTWVVY